MSRRTCVELARGEVRGGSNDLDAALVRSVVGPRPLEGGQEAVVDVDGVLPVAVAEVGAEDLHRAAREGRIGGSFWVDVLAWAWVWVSPVCCSE